MRSVRKNAREQRAQQLSSTFTPFSFENSDSLFSLAKPQPVPSQPISASQTKTPHSNLLMGNEQQRTQLIPYEYSNNSLTNFGQMQHDQYPHSLTQTQFNSAQILYYQQLRAAYFKEQEVKKMRGLYLDTMLEAIALDYLQDQDLLYRNKKAQQKHAQEIDQYHRCAMRKDFEKSKDNKPTVYVINDKPPKKIQLTEPKLSKFRVAFSIDFVRIDTDQSMREVTGDYDAGYVNPYKQSTIRAIANLIVSKVEGVNFWMLEKVVINDNSREICMRIVVMVQPLQLSKDLQYTFLSYEGNIIKGLRIQSGNVQLSWTTEVQSDGFDLWDQICIEGNSVKLSERLAKDVTLIFRCLELKEQSLEGFLEQFRKQNPGLAKCNIGCSFYDRELNIGMVYLSSSLTVNGTCEQGTA